MRRIPRVRPRRCDTFARGNCRGCVMQIGPGSFSSCPKDTLEFAARERDECFAVPGGWQYEAASGQRLDNLLAAVPIAPKQFECVSFRVVEEKELVDLRLAPELLAAELRELPLPEPHADRLLIELNPAEGDGDERKDHATRSLEVTNAAGRHYIYPPRERFRCSPPGITKDRHGVVSDGHLLRH